MSVVNQLNKIRRATNWSQETLAQQLDVSFATLNSWLNNRSRPRKQALTRIEQLYVEVVGSRQFSGHSTEDSAGLQVFFTTPFAGKSHYQPYIDAIVHHLQHSHSLVSPELHVAYGKSIEQLQQQGLNLNQAHYAYIRQSLASADAIIIEASEEDIRVGHEMTLALLFHKPTLILSQHIDFERYITHDLLWGGTYSTAEQAVDIVDNFLANAVANRPQATMQTFNQTADDLHSASLAKLRRLARQEPGQFGDWSRRSQTAPRAVAAEIQSTLGSLQPQAAWSVFAPVYNEDSPDHIQRGVAKWVDATLQAYKITSNAHLVEAAGGTGALSRQLATLGYNNISMFDSSRPMLAEAFRLCANIPQITLLEADIKTLALREAAAAIVWTDYSANFAMDHGQLRGMLDQLLANLLPGGLLLFDIRTYGGWQIDFYSQPVTTFATERFQRIWLNQQDKDNRQITFDVYIRVRDTDGAWAPWQRETMKEFMWKLDEVRAVIDAMPGCKLVSVHADDFRALRPGDNEPGLAYLVLQKLGSD